MQANSSFNTDWRDKAAPAEGIEITGLVVSPSARRLGVGRALVAASEAWASRLGFSSIRVRSNVSRAESHPFYRRIGFSLTKTQHVYQKSLPDAGESLAPADRQGESVNQRDGP